MSVRVKDYTNRVILDTSRKSSLALRFMTDSIQDASLPKTPKDKGNLRQNVLKTVIGLRGTIKWGQKYASILENKQFANYTTAGTGPHYAENAVMKVVRNPSESFRKAGLI